MKLDEVRLAIEPRSVGACIDLAGVFYRSHFSKIAALTCVFGGPATMVSYKLTQTTSVGWLWAAGLFFFMSPFLGAALTAGAGRWVFGEPFTVGRALKVFLKRIWTLLYLLVLTRLVLALSSIFCWTLPTIPLATRYSFISEVVLLEDLGGTRIGQRVEELTRRIFWEEAGRYLVIASFATVAWLSLFTLVDVAAWILLDYPILIGRLSSDFFYLEIPNLLTLDPLVVSALAATAWLVYPLARLAWFFCYLDARIRKEGWDIELGFRLEAQRLATHP